MAWILTWYQRSSVSCGRFGDDVPAAGRVREAHEEVAGHVLAGDVEDALAVGQEPERRRVPARVDALALDVEPAVGPDLVRARRAAP